MILLIPSIAPPTVQLMISTKRPNGAKPVVALDLFCGAGGLTHGLIRAGIQVVAGVDIDSQCEYPFSHNNPGAEFVHKSVEGLFGEDLARYYPNDCIRVLVGCAPCQPFSTYTQGLDTEEDTKWEMLNHFSRLIGDLQPDIVSMENVPELTRRDRFDQFVACLEDLKYFVTHSIVNCQEHGVPQKRRRLVLLASRRASFTLVPYQAPPEEALTVLAAIGGLKKVIAGEADPSDPLHRAPALSALNLSRIKTSKPGGTWRDWPSSLQAKCHKARTGRWYSSVYGRMRWDEPAPTITTQFYGFGSGRFGHPEQNRALTLREGALLQSFPVEYEFVQPGKPVSFSKIGKLVGNAVPVKLGEAIGRSILEHVRITDGSSQN